MQTGKYKLDYYLASPIHHLYVMAMAVTDSLMIKPHQKPKKTAQNSGTASTFWLELDVQYLHKQPVGLSSKSLQSVTPSLCIQVGLLTWFLLTEHLKLPWINFGILRADYPKMS